MQRKMRFTGIVTQGASRMGTAEFIKAFKVASSLDGKTYTMYRSEGDRRDYVRTTQCNIKQSTRAHKLPHKVEYIFNFELFKKMV